MILAPGQFFTRGLLLKLHAEGKIAIHIHQRVRAMKRLGRDADDRGRLPIHNHVLADYARVAGKAPLPVAVAQNEIHRGICFIAFAALVHAPVQRVYSQHGEEIRCHITHRDAFGAVIRAQADKIDVVAGNVRELVRVFAVVLRIEVGGRVRILVPFMCHGQHHQFVGIVHRQRPQ